MYIAVTLAPRLRVPRHQGLRVQGEVRARHSARPDRRASLDPQVRIHSDGVALPVQGARSRPARRISSSTRRQCTDRRIRRLTRTPRSACRQSCRSSVKKEVSRRRRRGTAAGQPRACRTSVRARGREEVNTCERDPSAAPGPFDPLRQPVGVVLLRHDRLPRPARLRRPGDLRHHPADGRSRPARRRSTTACSNDRPVLALCRYRVDFPVPAAVPGVR